jgi:metal-responsive CopG/Arc/MetJ family transcriptional regulator
LTKIRIDKDLYEKVKIVSEREGYSSVEEFMSHLLEKVVSFSETDQEDETLIKRLQGLGYIS